MDNPTMSLEELEEFYSESGQELQDLSKTGEEIVTMVQALECLCERLEQKTELTPGDIEGVNTLGMFTAEATGTEVGVIVPSLESDATLGIALEGLGDKIQNGLSSLAQSSEMMMDIISKRFLSMKSIVQMFQTRSSELRGILSDLGEERTRTIKVRFSAVRGDKGAATFDEYVARVRENNDLLESVIGTFNRRGKTLQKTNVDAFTSFMTGGYSESMAECFNYFNDTVLAEMTNNFMTAKEMGAQLRHYSKPMLNDHGLYIRRCKVPMGKDDDRAAVRTKIDILKWEVERPSQRALGREKFEMTYTDVTMPQIQALLDQNDRLVTLISRYQDIGGHEFEAHRRTISTLIKIWGVGSEAARGAVVGNMLAQVPGIVSYIKTLVPAVFVGKISMVLAGTIAGGALGYASAALVDWLRRAVLGFVFSTMKLQYRITAFMGWMNTEVVHLAIQEANRGFSVVKKYTK